MFFVRKMKSEWNSSIKNEPFIKIIIIYKFESVKNLQTC